MRQKNPKYMKEIEDYVDEYYSLHHKSPSCREIAENTTLQRSAVQRYLVAMNDQGMIKYDGRTIHTKRMQSYAPDTTSVGVIGTIACGPPGQSTASAAFTITQSLTSTVSTVTHAASMIA